MSLDESRSNQLYKVDLREQALAGIRSQIVGGMLVPGEIYSIGALAEAFNVSATPVREALVHLASEGLVETVRNRGFRVPIIDEASLDEIVELRRMLEVGAVGRLAALPEPPEMTTIRARALEMVALATDAGLSLYLTADRDFHLSLLRMLGMPRLVKMVASLRDQTRLYGMAALGSSGGIVASAKEHLDILDAIATQDRSLSEKLMDHHLLHARGIWAGHEECQ